MRRLIALGCLLCYMSSVATARLVEFELTLNGRSLLTATVACQPDGDTDAAWHCLKSACFTRVTSAEGGDVSLQPGMIALRGTIEVRTRNDGSARFTCLRLIPCRTADKTSWKVHPADFLASCRRRELPEQAALASPALPVSESPDDCRVLVIAHRGASGYLPEHTREATCLAYGMHADVIEQDVVLTRDGVPIVSHDIYLDTVTNIADEYPRRSRDDGRWYAIDFTLAEIQRLRVNERVHWPSRQPVFVHRFPQGRRIISDRDFCGDVGLNPGVKSIVFPRCRYLSGVKSAVLAPSQGQDLTSAVIRMLKEYGYTSRRQHAYLQCFEADELRRLRTQFDCRLALIQLIGDDEAAERMWSREGLAEIAGYADGVGPSIDRILTPGSAGDHQPSPLVDVAHLYGLVVHPYTVRRDSLPEGFGDDVALVGACARAGVDGLFCDFPDRAREALRGDGAE